jgi:hypothetical protein
VPLSLARTISRESENELWRTLNYFTISDRSQRDVYASHTTLLMLKEKQRGRSNGNENPPHLAGVSCSLSCAGEYRQKAVGVNSKLHGEFEVTRVNDSSPELSTPRAGC